VAATVAVCVESCFFIGHESPQQSQSCAAVVALGSLFFMGQESPQHLCSPLAWSADISCPFIGHESFLQHDILSSTLLTEIPPYANAAIAKLITAKMANANNIFFFMILFSYFLKPDLRADFSVCSIHCDLVRL
jgi:hypothetical protein